ncbi:MAG: beta-phosphoglucomutase family hydrolase [Actinomycetota bacterium]|nr:beta-phosphoglucomutase family hydrolase [Actinomycetota bacterium]
MFGLPDPVVACLFDLDGVLTDTASVHARAWKATFDDYLRETSARTGGTFSPFDIHDDYDRYVDGKPRAAGVRDFLASRGIRLPEGREDDTPSAETVQGLGNRKNELLLALIRRDGVAVFEGSRRYLEAARAGGMRTAVVSSSANTAEVTAVTGLDRHLEVRVDGVVAEQQHLAGKPAPDTFLEAARRLGVEPAAAAVFEDALAGVEAGRAGRFGAVIGVDRVGQRDALAAHGATRVVSDLSELLDP